MESEHNAVCRIISVEDFDNFRRATMTATVDLPAMDSSAPLDVKRDAGEPGWGLLIKLPDTAAAPGIGL
ncbi:hypothetical protein [Paraburkholderia atlantica]|uniref:hypothetical protein n=1 Tax=Paraburkholderia atlantica TaxID=2654982 RepID=UPI0004782F13|nr:hypothetical protein [Paraburkholderia atlantica]